MAELKEELIKKLEDHCKELEDNNNKLTKQVSGQASLQGEKHLIWDMIIVEANKLQPYLDFIQDKGCVTQEVEKYIHRAK